jgi:hypothetical protein
VFILFYFTNGSSISFYFRVILPPEGRILFYYVFYMISFYFALFAGEAQPDVCDGKSDRKYAGAETGGAEEAPPGTTAALHARGRGSRTGPPLVSLPSSFLKRPNRRIIIIPLLDYDDDNKSNQIN